MSMFIAEEEQAWSCYCASYAGIIAPTDGAGAVPVHMAAAVAIGAQDRNDGTKKGPRARSFLLAEVARLCGEGTEPDGVGGYDAGIIAGQKEGEEDVLDRLEKWAAEHGYQPGATPGNLLGWVEAQRKAVSS